MNLRIWRRALIKYAYYVKHVSVARIAVVTGVTEYQVLRCIGERRTDSLLGAENTWFLEQGMQLFSPGQVESSKK